MASSLGNRWGEVVCAAVWVRTLGQMGGTCRLITPRLSLSGVVLAAPHSRALWLCVTVLPGAAAYVSLILLSGRDWLANEAPPRRVRHAPRRGTSSDATRPT